MGKKHNSADSLPSRRKVLAVAMSTAVAGTNAAQSQEVLEEIIVTATKREESLQDIPMAVTAFTGAQIVREGFKQLDDYAAQIPSLSYGRREPGGTNVIMRGCAVSGIAFSDNPTTSVYLDEQPITVAGFNPDPRLIDINRVEALSGPQGTLFGDASQCGTLRIITNKPDAGQFESWVDVDGSKVEHGDLGYDVSGMVNLPLADNKLALRLVGFYAEEAGYIDNILGPSPGGTFDNAPWAEDDINTTTVKGGRIGLRWTPNDNWTVDAQAIYQRMDARGFGDHDLSEQFHAGVDIGKREQLRFSNDDWDDEWYQLALTAEAKLGFADVTVMGSFMNRKTRYDADSTAYLAAWQAINTYVRNYYNAYATIYDWGGDPHAFSDDDGETDRWTVEARISTPSDSDSRWGGILGFFYNKSENHTVFTANVRGMGDGCSNAIAYSFYLTGCSLAHSYLSYLHYYYFGTFKEPSDNWWTGVYDDTLKQVAVFGEISFDVTENFTITAGGRWFEVKQDRTLMNGNSLDPRGSDVFNCGTDAQKAEWQVNGIPQPGVRTCYNDSVAKSKESDWVPKVNATYRFDDDKMVYFTYSEGFRRGGVNAAKVGSFAAGGALHEFSSDTMENFEAGAKTTWLDGRFRVNLTGYHMIWKDIQLQGLDPDPDVFFTLGVINLPEAEINGVEADFALLPAEGWNITGNVGYNNAELSKDFSTFGQTLTEGTRLPIMPEWKTSLTVEYTWPGQVFGAEPHIIGTWTYQDESFNSLEGIGGTAFFNPVRRQDPYHLVNLRAGLTGSDWSATFYINNLTDEYAEQFFNDRWVQTRLSINRPRTFGINVRKYFGK